MCKYKSGIIFKDHVVLTPMTDESHSALLQNMGIDDTLENACRAFARVELVPKNGDRATDPKSWKFIVDQDILPDWYEDSPEKYEQMFREKVEDWVHKNTVVMCGKSWTVLKKDALGTYYLLNGIVGQMPFGPSTNYAESYIPKRIDAWPLTNALRAEFGDRMVPITLDLCSRAGGTTYGSVDAGILAIPTSALHRECKNRIPNLDTWWWLSTSESAGTDPDYVWYVRSDGYEDYADCHQTHGVRPFCIIRDI